MQIIEKPWGREEVVEINDKYMVKHANIFLIFLSERKLEL